MHRRQFTSEAASNALGAVLLATFAHAHALSLKDLSDAEVSQGLRAGLAETYNKVAAKVAAMGLVRKEDATIEQYVTGKSLDALHLMIGDEERKIRRDPGAAGSAAVAGLRCAEIACRAPGACRAAGRPRNRGRTR